MEEFERVQRLYGGTPMTSRSKWLAISAGWVIGCVAGLIAVFTLTDGIWMAAGLTVVAFFAGHLPELFTARYRDYREEWELANRDPDRGPLDSAG